MSTISMYDVKQDSFTIDEALATNAVISMRMCWDSISSDCFIDENGEPDESITLTRDEVLELVFDAGRLEDYGMNEARYLVWAKWYNINHFELLAKRAFPATKYCQ